MVDREALAAWIQPQHLQEEAIGGYRDAFAAHPARMLVLENFLVDDVAEKLNRFLATEADYYTEYGVYSVEGAVSEAQWLEAAEDDRFFRLGKLSDIRPEFLLSPNSLTYLQFRQIFQQPGLKSFFEAITGLALSESDDFGSHSMRAGDFLRPHSDDNRNRRVAIVLYLSKDWEVALGGVLRMIDSEGRESDVDPSFNNMVVFDVLAETTHYVTRVEEAAGDRARLSIGGWYHRSD